MLPETPQIEALLAVAGTRHFGRAAEQLHVTQSTVSHRIAALERTLGLQLLIRGRGPVEPTAAGAAFLRRAAGVLRDLERAELEARDAAAGQRQRLVIGYSGTITCGGIMDGVDALLERMPDVTLELQQRAVTDQLQALDAGQIDLAVTFRQLPTTSGFVVAELAEQNLYAWIGRGSALAGRGHVSSDELARHRLVWLSEYAEKGFEDHATARLGPLRRPPVAVDSLDAAFDVVRRGLGVLVLPDTAVVPAGVERLELTPARNATIRIARRARPGPALELLWSLLLSEATP